VGRTTAVDGQTTVVTRYEGRITRGFDAAGEQTVAHTDALGRTVRRETYHRPGTGPSAPHVLYSTSESEYDGLGRVLAVYQNRQRWCRRSTTPPGSRRH
jgi:hypothetical protein